MKPFGSLWPPAFPASQPKSSLAAISRSDSDLATKADLAAAISELKADVLKAAIAIAVGIVTTNVGSTVASIKLLKARISHRGA